MPHRCDEPAASASDPPADPSPAHAPGDRRWRRAGFAVGLVLLVALYLALYLPQLTTVPPVYSDDFILSQAAASFARDGTLEFTINSSPFDDPRILGTTEKNRAFLEEGYFIAMGTWFRVVGASITSARLFSCLAGLLYLVVMVLVFSRLAGVLPAFAACTLTLLETSFWYTARTVRPDLPTALCCALGLLLLLAPPPRARWGTWLVALGAGLAFGAGSTMHPNFTVYVLPALVLLFHRRGLAGDRGRILAVVLGVLLLFVPYAVDLGRNWSEVQKTLNVHSDHTDSLERASRQDASWRHHWIVANVVAEWGRYTSTAGNDHNVPTRTVLLVLECVAVVLLGVRVAVGRWRRRRDRRSVEAPPEDEPDRGLVFICLASMVVVMAVTVTYKVPLYLVHVFPWLHLAVALAVLDGGAALAWLALRLAAPPEERSGGRWREAAAMGGALLLCLVLVPYVRLTGRAFHDTIQGYARAEIISYEELSSLLARYVPPGSVVFSSPNGWPVAVKSSALLISNRMYPYQQVPMPEFPWRYECEGSHLLSYRLDVTRLEHIARTSGKKVFVLADEFDWAWHGFYPFGVKYGQSYSQLQADLARHFRLVVEVVTEPRGQVRLFEYVPESMSAMVNRESVPLFVERSPVTTRARVLLTLDDLRARAAGGAVPVCLAASDKPVPLVKVPRARGHIYRVTLRASARDGAVLYPVFAGVASTEWRALRLMDSPWPVTYTHYLVARTDDVELFLQFLAPRGTVELQECLVEEF